MCALRFASTILLFLLLLSHATAAPIYWRDLSGCGTDRGVHKETGYPTELLNLVWDRYARPRRRTGIVDAFRTHGEFTKYADIGIDATVAIMLYVALWYIHTHPVLSVIGQRDFRDFGRVTEQKFYSMVVPVLIAFASEVDEIHDNDRYHPRNHGTGLFAQYISCFVDTAPVYVVEPDDEQLTEKLMQPKYGECVYKFQVAVNHLGWICCYTGLHYGTTPDNVIYDETYHLHPLKSWEFWCGDGIYNSCYGVLTRFRLVAKGVFTRLEVFMNSYINHYRQRAEHVMHTIKDHAMWSGKKLKCSYAMIYWSMRLTVHLTNIKIKHGWADEAYHKYPGFYREWPAGP